jgi:hypothetical protein
MYIFTPNTLIKSAEINANFTESLDVTKFNNPYQFAAYPSADQTTVATTFTKLNFNTEEYDTNNNYNTSTYGYTIPVTGYYQFSLQAILLAQAGLVFLLSLSKNGTGEWLRMAEIPNTTGNITIGGSHTVKLTAGEIIYPLYYSGSAGKTILATGQYNRFSAYFLGS